MSLRIVDINLKPINKLQQEIMKFVDWWAREKKTPIPRKEIIEEMESQGITFSTTRNAINSLLKKGYIRRAVMASNKTFYVQLRGI